MKSLLKVILVLVVLGAGGYFGFPYAMAYWKARHKPEFRSAEVKRGEIISVVNATGEVQPVLRVEVGSFVSGPITDLYVDFNDEVHKDEVLAEIDTRLFDAAVARDKALLATRKAEVTRVEALLEQARHAEDRAKALQETNPDFISEAELDDVKYSRLSLEAQLEVARAAIDQAQANLVNSQANLGYTKIRSPVDGIVIDRKIDPGQTLAAQFQTPVLFVVAPKMREKVYVYASVDEADIGLIRQAQDENHVVKFTVDAYPDDLFEGHIVQVRLNPTTMQNVVTYPVVVEAPNPDLKLLPGMTASLSFEVDRGEDLLKIPNAALRFYPKLEYVRKEDRKLLDGADEETESGDLERSAEEEAKANRKRDRRHVWITENDLLKAVEVVTGLSDSRFTELVSGALKQGQKLVTGVGKRAK